MEERGVEERLARLEERLARLEQRLGGPVAPESPARPQPQPAPQIQPLPPALRPPPLPRAVVVPRPVVTPPPMASSQPAVAQTLETQVGLKWAGWVGAIIVVIGAALGIKYAYDQNWFGALSPAARLALLSLGGFGLIGAGEVVYRRVGMLASAGLFGAGVATLFVVSYAGYGYFALYDRGVAYALMAACTLIGAGVAVRANLVSIAVLTIVGGNVAPIALQGSEARLTALLAYVLAMQVVALVLAWWGRGPKWWTLRGVALATICLWMAIPVVASASMEPAERQTALVFALIYAALFHIELVLSSLRKWPANTTREPAFAVPVPLGQGDDVVIRQGLGVTFSVLVTAALTIAVLMLRLDGSQTERGIWVMGLGACCLLLGLALPRVGRGERVLARGLAIGYRIQAAALVVVAVPVMLSGMWVTIAWSVLATALALVGARLNVSVSRGAAAIVWMLAALHMAAWSFDTAATATWAVLLGSPIPAYLVLAAVVAVVGHAVAALVREDFSPASVARATFAPELEEFGNGDTANGSEDDGDRPHDLHYERPDGAGGVARHAGPGFAVLAGLVEVLAALVFALAAMIALPRVGFTFAAVCYAWALIGAGQIIRSAVLHPMALAMLLVCALKWMLYDTLEPRLSLGGATAGAYSPLYNPAVAVGAALFVSGMALRWTPLRTSALGRHESAARRSSENAIHVAGGFLAMFVLLWGVTLEIDRYYEIRAASATAAMTAREYELAKQVAISIVWSLYAVGCVVTGFAIRVAGLRYFGLALFALTVGKVMLVDLRGVGAGYRTLSFLGLGLLLLGTSVLYGKLSPRLLGREPGDNGGDSLNPVPQADDKVGEGP